MTTTTLQKPAATPLLTPRQFGELCTSLVSHGACTGQQHSFIGTVKWLTAHACDIRTNIEKLADLQAMCDCDVLIYASEEQWEASQSQDSQGVSVHGEQKWQAFITELLNEAGAEIE